MDETAEDYAAYFKKDMKALLSPVDMTVDEMLTRLDEFENLVYMVRGDASLCVDDILPKIVSSKPHLDDLFERVDRLEQLVLRVEADLTQVEATLDQAEEELSSSNSGKLRSLLKPLFFKTTTETTERKLPRVTPTQALSELYSTENYFPPQDE